MSTVEIRVTRCIGAAATSDSDIGGWMVSYIKRQFQTKQEASDEADRLQSRPTSAEVKAIAEGRFVDC
jgi:hypothetical protein